MNLFGFKGLDGGEVPETGVLDVNTLVAWDSFRHPVGYFDKPSSAIMQVLLRPEEETLETQSLGLPGGAPMAGTSGAGAELQQRQTGQPNYLDVMGVDPALGGLGAAMKKALQNGSFAFVDAPSTSQGDGNTISMQDPYVLWQQGGKQAFKAGQSTATSHTSFGAANPLAAMAEGAEGKQDDRPNIKEVLGAGPVFTKQTGDLYGIWRYPLPLTAARGDGNTISMPEYGGNIFTEEDMKANALFHTYNAAFAKMYSTPLKFFYNSFNKGNYNPENAYDSVDRFLRRYIVNAEWQVSRAKYLRENIDDTTQIGKTYKDIVLPAVEKVPQVLLDIALIAATGGGAAIPMVGRRISISESLKYIAMQPVTLERTLMYFMDDVNVAMAHGDCSLGTITNAMIDAVNKSMIDGLGMGFKDPLESGIIEDIFHGNVGKAIRKVVQGRLESWAKEIMRIGKTIE